MVAEEVTVSKISDLMVASSDQMAEQKTIRIKGSVSLVGDGITTSPGKVKASQSFCVEDQTAGIWVRSGHAIKDGLLDKDDPALPRLDRGVEIELEGYLDQGAFAPVVMPTRITILGESSLPAAPRAESTRFLNGADDLRRVSVNGVVQSIYAESPLWWSLRVETGVGHFVTRVPKEERYQPSRLLDSEVELTGVAAVCWNWRSEFVCPRMIVSSRDDIKVLESSSDPFAAELVSVEKIDGYTPSGRPRHRRRIEGTVTYYDGDLLLYVQDRGVGIQVRLNDPVSINIGDRVEVSGFIDTSRYLAGLRGAVLRQLDQRQKFGVIATTVTRIIEDHQGFHWAESMPFRSCDGQLIQLSGRLLDFQAGNSSNPHRLEIDCGDAVTTAFLSGQMKELLPGTELKVTGIAKLIFSVPDATASLAKPERVDLLMRDANDILVVSKPSWWTPRRTLYAFLILSGFALLASLSAFAMRRALAQRTDQLAREMSNRRDAALEFQGAIRERTRLAANLHDTLLQTMAGIAYQIEACGQLGEPEQKTLRTHLDTAGRMVQHGQEDLRNTVWALHCLPLTEKSFVESVRQVTRKFATGQRTTILVHCSGDFPFLADFIAGNLLLVIQESIHNAIKYADAENIDIQLDASPDQERVTALVRDNGVGFDVKQRKASNDGHFGLEGMEQRIERLGGHLTIESQVGVGTCVQADIPLLEFDTEIA